MFHDPISDFLTRIRNAQAQTHRFVDIPLSKMKVNLAKVLEEQGFTKGFVVNQEKRMIRIYLKYDKRRKPLAQDLKRVSKPGLRRYVGYQDIPKVLGGMGIAILSTNQGVVDGETARERKLGGELLCTIW